MTVIIRHIHRLFVSIGFFVVCLLAGVRPVHAMPNGSSFDDAAASVLNYRKSVVETSQVKCASLVSRSDYVNSIYYAAPLDGHPELGNVCEVRGVIVPEVRYILYLPMHWNGRLYMHGNWDYAGESLDNPNATRRRLKAVANGFAVAFTNMGHDGAAEPGGTWAYKNLEKEVDYGFRAVHLTALTAKTLIGIYYGRGPNHSYFDGCSTGGRTGLLEAQRFPSDFDGILVGAPVMDLSHMLWQYWRNQMAISETPLTDAKLALLAKYVFGHFDAKDGVRDGVISDPLAIDFDPARDLPRATNSSNGFTDAEIKMLSKIYSPVMVGGKEIFPRTVVGGEARGQTYVHGTYDEIAPISSWHTRVVPDADGNLPHRDIVDSWFKYIAFEVDDPNLDWHKLDPERDLPRTTLQSRLMDATDPDLGAYFARNGKLIVYHGWADLGVNPLRTLEYYKQVEALLGAKAVQESMQLYLVPGMFHCRGGLGTDRFDLMTPLINWVESGTVPTGLVGKRIEHGKVTRTRPLCPYPSREHYRGSGDTADHRNFDCIEPK